MYGAFSESCAKETVGNAINPSEESPKYILLERFLDFVMISPPMVTPHHSPWLVQELAVFVCVPEVKDVP